MVGKPWTINALVINCLKAARLWSYRKKCGYIMERDEKHNEDVLKEVYLKSPPVTRIRTAPSTFTQHEEEKTLTIPESVSESI